MEGPRLRGLHAAFQTCLDRVLSSCGRDTLANCLENPSRRKDVLMGRQRKGGEEESEVADDFPAVDPLELRPSEREMLFDKHAQFCQNVRSNAEAEFLDILGSEIPDKLNALDEEAPLGEEGQGDQPRAMPCDALPEDVLRAHRMKHKLQQKEQLLAETERLDKEFQELWASVAAKRDLAQQLLSKAKDAPVVLQELLERVKAANTAD